MPSLAVLGTLVRELTTSQRAARICEPALVMEDEASVRAYTEAGRELGVMAPVYLFHTMQVCEVIRPGDVVLDLACGPATQLVQIARVNPQVRFVGLDLSGPMLERAAAYARDQGVDNITFCQGAMDDLSAWEPASVDAVMSTMALHHLRDRESLARTFCAVARVLKPDGGLYMVDFGRLKSERSMRYFAHQYADRQPAAFTDDYFNSLRAAFSVRDFRAASRALTGRARLFTTFLSPYMVALKSRARGEMTAALRAALERLRDELQPHQRRDFHDLATFFRLGGLKLPLS